MAHDGVDRAGPGAAAFAAFVFLLTAAPKVNIRVGPAPLYLIDGLIVLCLAYAVRAPGFPPGRRPFLSVVASLYVLSVASELGSVLYAGGGFEQIYLAGRTTLAFSAFYITGQLVRGSADLRLALRAAALGTIVTASLMILSSLPMTRAAVTDLVLAQRFLEPAADGVAARFGSGGAYDEQDAGGVRGRTLVGVSILGATFLNVLWPLAALAARGTRDTLPWRSVAECACLLAPMGVLFSYSRGPIFGAFLIVAAVLALGLSTLRRAVIGPVAAGAAVVLLIGVGSEVFFFERLTRSSAKIFDETQVTRSELERFHAYVEPFDHLLENPEFLILGEGNAVGRIAAAEKAGRANHALFAQAYYANGMVAAFLYMLLLAQALHFAFWHVRRRRGGLGGGYAQALLLSVIALLPWAAFGHAIVSTPRGMILFFVVLGLLTTLRRLPFDDPVPNPAEVRHGDSRHPAFG